jgi:ferric-dicitrate binding protein FerR (iron transport regulator)
LEDVVRELNRYRPGWIGFVDARAAAQRVTGSIDVSAPDRALQSLIESLPISGWRIADRWVFLYSRSSDR